MTNTYPQNTRAKYSGENRTEQQGSRAGKHSNRRRNLFLFVRQTEENITDVTYLHGRSFVSVLQHLNLVMVDWGSFDKRWEAQGYRD